MAIVAMARFRLATAMFLRTGVCIGLRFAWLRFYWLRLYWLYASIGYASIGYVSIGYGYASLLLAFELATIASGYSWLPKLSSRCFSTLMAELLLAVAHCSSFTPRCSIFVSRRSLALL